jgi:hypothetical protein
MIPLLIAGLVVIFVYIGWHALNRQLDRLFSFIESTDINDVWDD